MLLFFPVISSSLPRFLEEALSFLRTTRQLPSSSALTVFFTLPKVTLTSSPGLAQPQIGTGMSRWSTMLLPKTLGSLTSARAGK